MNKTAVVGDFIFDIEAGQSAGAFTVLLDNGKSSVPFPDSSDMRISRLGELRDIINED